MGMEKILIVEDDATIARFVELELMHSGYSVSKTSDGDEALALIEQESPDLVILDILLPSVDGIEIARRVRERGDTVPILMLTALSEAKDLVTGFDAGADDYLRKPFEISELLSRVRALLKRAENKRLQMPIEASGVILDPNSRRATMNGEVLDLTAKEYDLLSYLAANAGRVISRDEIISEVWAGQQAADSNVIEVFVCHLRNKIGDRDNTIIQTIRGVGYFFAKG